MRNAMYAANPPVYWIQMGMNWLFVQIAWWFTIENVLRNYIR